MDSLAAKARKVGAVLSDFENTTAGDGFPAFSLPVDRERRRAQNSASVDLRSAHTFGARRFDRDHGGKLLFYHGVSDPWFSAKDTIDYYRRMTAATGGESKVKDWSRLFLSPGMGHCAGGSATLDTFDMLSAAVNWVEKSQAPESVMATGRAFPGRSRPLYAYPAHAQYNGSGDPEDGRNYSCRQ